SPAKGISDPGPLSLVGGGLTRGRRALRRAASMGFPTRSSRFVGREILLVGLAAAASCVVINHDNLYLSHPFRLSDALIESYFLATAMVCLLLRLVIVSLEVCPSRGQAERVVCP